MTAAWDQNQLLLSRVKGMCISTPSFRRRPTPPVGAPQVADPVHLVNSGRIGIKAAWDRPRMVMTTRVLNNQNPVLSNWLEQMPRGPRLREVVKIPPFRLPRPRSGNHGGAGNARTPPRYRTQHPPMFPFTRWPAPARGDSPTPSPSYPT